MQMDVQWGNTSAASLGACLNMIWISLWESPG